MARYRFEMGRFECHGEAVLAAMAEAQPGGRVHVHQADCSMTFSDQCDCEPQIVRVGEG